MSATQVILLERVESLGQMGDVVRVKPGYARNFLLPQKKAMRATKENLAVFEKQRAQLVAQNLARKGEAEAVAEKMANLMVAVIRQAGESGQLYGSVSPRDIVDAAAAQGVKIDRGHVQLTAPIKTIGVYQVAIAPHPEVEVMVTLNVARSPEEAQAQARGEVLTGPVSDRAEIRAAAEALFEEAQAEAAAEENG